MTSTLEIPDIQSMKSTQTIYIQVFKFNKCLKS